MKGDEVACLVSGMFGSEGSPIHEIGSVDDGAQLLYSGFVMSAVLMVALDLLDARQTAGQS